LTVERLEIIKFANSEKEPEAELNDIDEDLEF
jgi:hypothetical protein